MNVKIQKPVHLGQFSRNIAVMFAENKMEKAKSSWRRICNKL